jgi:hypothetical protein
MNRIKSVQRFNQRQSKSNRSEILSSQSTVQHGTRITTEIDSLTQTELEHILQIFVLDLSRIDDETFHLHHVNKILVVLLQIQSTHLSAIVEHRLFSHLRTSLIHILKQWQSTSHLNDIEIVAFGNLTKLIRLTWKHTTKIDIYATWLCDATLLDSIRLCLIVISSAEKILDEYIVKLLSRLLNVYRSCQKKITRIDSNNANRFSVLLDSIIQCLSCSHVINTFLNIDPTKTSLATKEKFFLLKCSMFLLSYHGKSLILTMITNDMENLSSF